MLKMFKYCCFDKFNTEYNVCSYLSGSINAYKA